MKTKLPLAIFLALCTAFILVQISVNAIAQNYTAVHFFFGFAAPLAFGCVPFQVFKWRGWTKLPVNYEWAGWSWSPLVGIVTTLFVSAFNEVYTDPMENGIPFLQAWHHLAADVAGVVLFWAVYVLFLRPRFTRHPAPKFIGSTQ
ncbi:hypothetical protein [Hydrogenophaga sp. 2FB]|uniref:hypothetical protein n=1 Tax=Hydrogenophaga sp. 2FB TaxID=2502187 RepID=UPI0010F88B94|nr:hypothetical protein [Hydrogenophaga sp. 2FB]